jgi:hypothetical protein
MRLKEYSVVLLLLLLAGWGSGHGLVAGPAPRPVHVSTTNQEVLPLAFRYRQEVQKHIVVPSLVAVPLDPAAGHAGSERCPDSSRLLSAHPAAQPYALLSLRW